MFEVNVNIAYDPTMGALFHNTIPPVVPVPSPSVEMIATQMWTYGYYLNQNKLTKKVLHKNFYIVLDGHDIGAMIPDITPAQMANAYYAVMWPFSSRKIIFKTSKVKMEKVFVGCSQVFAPPFPMMTCGDPVSALIAFPLINKLNTVIVGITLKDVFVGLLQASMLMALDFVFDKIGKPIDRFAKKIAKKAAEKVMKKVGRKVVKEVAKEAAEEAAEKVTKRAMAKAAASEALGKLLPTSPAKVMKTGLAGAAGLATTSLEGNPTYKVSTGGGPLGGEVGYTWGGDKPGWKAQGNVLGWQRDTDGKGANWGDPL